MTSLPGSLLQIFAVKKQTVQLDICECSFIWKITFPEQFILSCTQETDIEVTDTQVLASRVETFLWSPLFLAPFALVAVFKRKQGKKRYKINDKWLNENADLISHFGSPAATSSTPLQSRNHALISSYKQTQWLHLVAGYTSVEASRSD